MKRRYAEKTSVPSDKSKTEIERILIRYGADGFAYMSNPDRAAIAFRAANRNIRFVLPMPKLEEVNRTNSGRVRAKSATQEAHSQETRRRWRALALSIKAKLETVESGIAEFETEFMPYIVLPGGETVAEKLQPQIEAAYKTGKPVKLLEAMDG